MSTPQYERKYEHALTLAIGRLFRMLSRPFQDGDLECYERCRKVVLDSAEQLGFREYRAPKTHQETEES